MVDQYNNQVPRNEGNNAANNPLAQARAQIQAHLILLAHDRNRPIRDYVSPNRYDFSPRITRPTFQWSRFQMNPVMLQMPSNASNYETIWRSIR